MPDSNDSHKERIIGSILQKFSLKDKVVIITGGAGILGKVFAKTFLEFGAKVAILDLNPVALAEVEESLKVFNGDLTVYKCNLTDKPEVLSIFEEIFTRWGSIDILINNAAAKSENFFEPIEDYFLEDWREVFENNLTSMFICTQAALKHMQKQNSGSIVNLSSIYGSVAPDPRIYEGSEYLGRPINTPVTYAVTKGAVPNFTRYLAVTQAPYGIRANAVSPGGVFSGQNEAFVEKYSSRSPMGRMANPDEIASAVLFLASEAASYVTGQNLMVDGGWTAW